MMISLGARRDLGKRGQVCPRLTSGGRYFLQSRRRCLSAMITIVWFVRLSVGREPDRHRRFSSLVESRGGLRGERVDARGRQDLTNLIKFEPGIFSVTSGDI